jgi:hypothetical protein
MSPKLHARRKMLAQGVVIDISVGLQSSDIQRWTLVWLCKVDWVDFYLVA